MKKLRQLLSAARALSSDVEVRLHGTENEALWICVVSVGGAILFESKPGPLDGVVEEGGRKLKSMSQRMRSVLVENGDEPPSS